MMRPISRITRVLVIAAIILASAAAPTVASGDDPDVNADLSGSQATVSYAEAGSDSADLGDAGITPTVTYETHEVCDVLDPFFALVSYGTADCSLPCEPQVGQEAELLYSVPVVDGEKRPEQTTMYCPSGQQVSTAALAAQAFARIPLPQPHLSIQPPKGRTLVGLETIYSTDTTSFARDLRLLGRRVTVRITPSSYAWSHGDGTSHTTDWAGRPWDDARPDIDDYVTHVYEHTGGVQVSVAVTWTASFRIGDGAWREIDGSGRSVSDSVALRVVEAEPELVAP